MAVLHKFIGILHIDVYWLISKSSKVNCVNYIHQNTILKLVFLDVNLQPPFSVENIVLSSTALMGRIVHVYYIRFNTTLDNYDILFNMTNYLKITDTSVCVD